MELRGVQLLIVVVGAITVPLQAQDTAISSFSAVQTGSSVRIALTFNSDIVGTSGCFFDKLTFVASATSTGQTGFTSMYSGLCDFSSQSRDTLIGTMDVRDFAQALQFQILTSAESTNIFIRGQSSVSLIPGISVSSTSSPVGVAVFSRFTGRPSLISFDVDLSTNRLLLHFDGLMDTSSVDIARLTLSSSTTRTDANSVTLTGRPSLSQDPHITTLCITLSAAAERICQTTCYCSITSALIADYVSNIVESVESLPVSVLRRSNSTDLPVFMRLSLWYIGCTAVHNLAEDEVYVIRPNEYVTRMECFTNNAVNSSNVRPQISRGNSFSGSVNATIDDHVVYNWPLNVYLNFSGALPPQFFGQYVCRSSVGYYIRNYVHDNNSNIELPAGSSFRVPVYDPLTIPLYFGSFPPIDLSLPSTEITLYNVDTGTGVQIEPEYGRINPYHVDIRYAMIEQVINGDYEIRIHRESVVIARQPITIEVTAPVLTLQPEVATVLPGQEEVVLSCTTNSPRLSVRWSSVNSGEILSSGTTYRVELPSESTHYNCSVVDTATDATLISAAVPVINVSDILSVWRDGNQLENNSFVELTNRGSEKLNLQCIEHVGAALTNLTWYVLPDNGSLFAPSFGKEGDVYRMAMSGNQATLTIDNAIQPFRGLLKCWSSSALVVNIKVVADGEVQLRTCKEEMSGDRSISLGDSFICQGLSNSPAWPIQWAETIAGKMDFQPCPEANGFALRRCSEDGTWNNTIYIDDCSSDSFSDLKDRAEDMVFRLKDAYNEEELEGEVEQLIRVFKLTAQPKAITHFPKDLDVAADVLESLVDLLSEESLQSTQTELVGVLDSLFHANNTEGWRLLTQIDGGSQRLLNISEGLGLYLLQSLSVGQLNNERTVRGVDIAYSAMRITDYGQDIVYPADLSRGAQITLPSSLLNESRATGVVHIIMNNLNCFLPKPDSSTSASDRCVASSVLSTQITSSSGVVTSFGSNQNITVQFLTKGVPRAVDPVCLFWDDVNTQWSSMRINSALLGDTSGEIKQFKVNCSSNHLTSFGVAVSTVNSEFTFSIPVYVGCGFVIFSSVLSIFSLLLSCMCDHLRRHSIVAFLVHLSFMSSLLCAYVAFLAGIEQASNDRIGCVAVAGLLHYFFTAAFTWLLLEGLLLIFFQTFSKYCGLFFIVLLIGWGLPAVPTAISLGVLHESYGTTQNCWIFFDGKVSDEVVLGFLIPKLVIIAVTIALLLIGCCTNYKFSNRKLQPYLKTNVTRILWTIWGSVCLFLIFLAASWVFALLLVNVYKIDSELLGWVFMVASILLGIWMFIFSFIVMVVNQKVDYDRLWNAPDPVYPSSDPGRGKGYQFMDISAVDLSGKRTGTLTRPPTVLSNPAYGMEHKEWS